MHIATNEAGLKYLNILSDRIQNLGGVFLCQVNVDNTLDTPIMKGNFLIRDGQFNVADWGTHYRNIQVELLFGNDFLSVKNFSLEGEEGTLRGSGQAVLEKPGDFSNLNLSNLVFRADHFLVANNRSFELLLSGDLKLWGALPDLQFNGDLTVVRSQIFSSFQKSKNSTLLDRSPMLLTAERGNVHPEQLPIKTTLSQNVALLKNFSGTLKIAIPRNTWIRNQEMNMEISGTMSVVKKKADTKLFGSLKIVRGTYNFYGKIFKVKSGTVDFQGDPTINPHVELEVEHLFRGTDRVKNWLILKISGTLAKPSFQFFLNDEAIDENNALDRVRLE